MKENLIHQMTRTPFVPHPAIKGAHAQTIMAFLIPRRRRLLTRKTEPRILDVGPGIQLLAKCAWQDNRTSRPTLIVVHGLEGSAESGYMLGTAEKALEAGFNVVRLNIRSCGGSVNLTPTIYHAGLTQDLHQIIEELSESDGLKQIYLAGFSLGGNMALKLAGEYADNPPEALRGIAAVSPSIHLASCADAIELRSNAIYHLSFIMSLRKSMRMKARLFPDRYDESRLRGIWSVRQFDAAYTAPHAGFRDVADYYERASALPYIKKISVPTLIIQAKDDPFIPFRPFESPEVSSNLQITFLAPEHGGHVGFVSARPEGSDHFWAEQKIVDFISLINDRSSEAGS